MKPSVFMNVPQCDLPVHVTSVLCFYFFALEAIHIVSAFMSSKIFIFELEAIPFLVPAIKAND